MAALDTKVLNIREKGLTLWFSSRRLIQVFSFDSSLLYFAEDIPGGTKKQKKCGNPIRVEVQWETF